MAVTVATPLFATLADNPQDVLPITGEYRDFSGKRLGGHASRKPLCRASFRLCSLLFPGPKGRVRFEGTEKTGRDLGYFVDCSKERGLVRFRRFAKAANFSNELQRRISNLLLSGRRVEVEEGLDIPAQS